MSSTSGAVATSSVDRRSTIAAAGVALAGIVIFAGNYDVTKGENGGTGPAVVTSVLCLALAAALFALVLPRVRNEPRAVIVLGVLTVLSLAVFWSGVTPVLAAATWAVAVRQPALPRGAAVMRWVAVAVAVLALAWTLANSHLF